MPGTIAPFPHHQFFDDDGDPAASYRLFTYSSGTSTKLSTYSDVDLSSANANPYTLPADARMTTYLTPGESYKFVLAPPGSDDPPTSPTWTQDAVSAVPPGSSSADVDVTGTA